MSDSWCSSTECSAHFGAVPWRFNVKVDPQYKGEYRMAQLKEKGLSNVASTILNLLGYEKVEDFDPSLIEFI